MISQQGFEEMDARVEALREEIHMLRAEKIELEKLVYFGEHHFPDLTWKSRCEEQEGQLKLLRAMRRQYHDISKRLLAQVPGAAYTAFQDFGELNDTLIAARKLLEEK